jgi:molecular chaperone HscB
MGVPSADTADVDFDPASDAFSIFGFERSWNLERDAVERRYLSLAQAVHPDRVATADAGIRRLAMERASAVNEAYKVLRDPVRRAEYLVKLGGIDLDSSDPHVGAPSMEQSFLMEMIERREHVADARAQGEHVLDELRDGVEDELDALLESAHEQLNAGEVRAAARTLVRRRYVQRLLDEIDGDSGTGSKIARD